MHSLVTAKGAAVVSLEIVTLILEVLELVFLIVTFFALLALPTVVLLPRATGSGLNVRVPASGVGVEVGVAVPVAVLVAVAVGVADPVDVAVAVAVAVGVAVAVAPLAVGVGVGVIATNGVGQMDPLGSITIRNAFDELFLFPLFVNWNALGVTGKSVDQVTRARRST